ncbi:hypothetical protein EDB89DRAFT_1906367 [Lactarius sanguifluus]|nr:hypothetical protein EDB89DRAFT_1906367 [Lactarius sanguifluus]
MDGGHGSRVAIAVNVLTGICLVCIGGVSGVCKGQIQDSVHMYTHATCSDMASAPGHPGQSNGEKHGEKTDWSGSAAVAGEWGKQKEQSWMSLNLECPHLGCP